MKFDKNVVFFFSSKLTIELSGCHGNHYENISIEFQILK